MRSPLSTPRLAAIGLALSAPLLAQAQLTVTGQRSLIWVGASNVYNLSTVGEVNPASMSDSRSGGFDDSLFTSQDTSAQAHVSSDFDVSAKGALHSTITGDTVGLSSAASLIFTQQTPSLGNPLTVSGQVSVQASITFSVASDTDVRITGSAGPQSTYYDTSGTFSTGAGLQRYYGNVIGAIDTNGYLPPGIFTPVPTADANGITHLVAGTYLLSLSTVYTPASGYNGPVSVFNADGTITAGTSKFVTPPSKDGMWASASVTAVPEPSTLALMGLGLVGMAGLTGLKRKKAAASAQA